MNKTELNKKVAEKTGMSQKDCLVIIDTFFDTIKDGMIEDGKVQIVGFGTFEVKDRPERECRNPATGDTILIPSCKVPKFKAGSALKEAVNA